MTSIYQDLKYNFLRRHGAIAQIIVISSILFVLTGITDVFFYLMQSPNWTKIYFWDWFLLPAASDRLIMRPWAFITYIFFHSNIMHILFNMLWLFWMGVIFREYFRDRPVWTTFILGGFTGGVFYVVAYNIFPVFESVINNSKILGGSAGVMAIVVATATHLPHYSINLLFFGYVRLMWIAIIYVLMDLISIPAGNPGGMISHLGGALFGFLYVYYKHRDIDLAMPLNKLIDWLAQLRLITRPQSKIRIVQTASGTKSKSATNNKTKSKSDLNSNGIGRPTQQEIDRVLDKIRLVGYERLTIEEKQILYRASQE